MKKINVLYILALFIILPPFLWCNYSNNASASTNYGYVVIEESTNRILFEENKDVKLPMASTTKIMTALVVLEHASLDDKVIIPKSAVGVEGSSIYLKAGEEYSVEDLLYGLMLRSGNDAAVALALYVSESIDGFAKLMNDKAKSLGAVNTNFVNPHGLHDDNHYTTAYDLAIITSSAYKNTDFQKIVSSKKYELKGNYIYNKNKLLGMYDGADGVKTGYTTKSGRCLVSASMRNGMRVICVVLNCYDMWNKSMRLMNDAHQNYKMVEILSKNTEFTASVEKGKEKQVYGSTKISKYYPLKDGEERLITQVKNVKMLKAPVYRDSIMGEVEVYFNKCLIFRENIYTISNVAKRSIFDWLKS